jgi:putative hydrolase of the HAD superfamily
VNLFSKKTPLPQLAARTKADAAAKPAGTDAPLLAQDANPYPNDEHARLDTSGAVCACDQDLKKAEADRVDSPGSARDAAGIKVPVHPLQAPPAQDGSPPSPGEGQTRQSEAVQSLATVFKHVDTWVFDLDNTLYPSDSDLWPKIDQRITLYLMQLFGLDGMSSRALQKYYYQRYGTTLRGLVVDHAISFEEFLDFVHDIDRSSLLPNPALAHAITALPGRKLILTNGSRDHALRTAKALGLEHMFEDIFDIVAADLLPKPEGATYQRFFDKHGIDPKTSAMFEDLAINLVVPHDKGMLTTLVVPKPGQADHREAFEIAQGAYPPHIDFVTSDLEGFLSQLIANGDGND